MRIQFYADSPVQVEFDYHDKREIIEKLDIYPSIRCREDGRVMLDVVVDGQTINFGTLADEIELFVNENELESLKLLDKEWHRIGCRLSNAIVRKGMDGFFKEEEAVNE